MNIKDCSFISLDEEGKMTIDTTRIYVYDGQEYVLTGRLASKPLSRNRKKMLVEIIPKDKGTNPRKSFSSLFNKWVEPKDLYDILSIEPKGE